MTRKSPVPPNNMKPSVELFHSEINSSPDFPEITPSTAAETEFSTPKITELVPAEPQPSTSDATQSRPDMDLQLMDFFQDTETDELLMSQMETMTKGLESHTVQHAIHQIKSSPNLPVFNNCKIGNITINFVKK